MSLLDDLDLSAVLPKVKVLGAGLNSLVEPFFIRAIVDTSVRRPDMFELTFVDETVGSVLDLALIDIGSELTISVGSMPTDIELMVGEVTSIEGDYEDLQYLTVVRGYEHSHRLQKARRSRTFLDSTDGDIARRVADEAKLSIGEISDPGVVHRYVAQVAQTDWDFLKSRANEIGYDLGVAGGKFYFKPAPGMSSGPLGGVVGELGLGTTLTFGKNLRWFRPRVTSAGMVPEAEVRVWDPESVGVVSGRTGLASDTADVSDDPVALATAHGGLIPGVAIPSIPGLPSFMDASNNAFGVVDRPLAWGSVTQGAADAAAAGMAEHAASCFAEAEGLALSAPKVTAGASVELDHVPSRFAGQWFVTTARHSFDVHEGYTVRFEVSGRHDRSLHGLATGSATNRRERGLIDGVVPGIVTNNVDEDAMHRVRVALPWLAPDFETDWARIVMPGLGVSYGLIAIPEVGDEVLVGFEFGDVRRAYVLGGLANGETKLELDGDPVKQGVPGGQVVKRGIVSRLGNQVLIDDDGDGIGPPTKSGILIGTGDDKIIVQLDDVNKKLTILCDSSGPPAAIEIRQSGSGGSILIEQAGAGGTLDIKSAGNVSVEAAAPGNLTLKGGAGVKIDGGSGLVELSGSMVKLN